MKNLHRVALVFLAASLTGFAQTTPPAASQPDQKKAPAAATAPADAQKPNKADAYYHYSLAHIYEELVTMYGRTEYASKAIEEYRAALNADPDSAYLQAGLAELYAKTGRIRDAVLEAQDILTHNPNNVDARKLLGRIYLRSLGDTQSNGTQSQEILKRAIEQYEAIIKLEPDSVDDHLLLGRLYRLNNDMPKAEQEFKTAVKLNPASEDAVTTLAYLYNEQGSSKKATEILNTIPAGERSAKVYYVLGFTYEQQKDYKNAIVAYKEAVEQDSDNLDAMRGLAQSLMSDGQTDAALTQYKKIIEGDPQDTQSYMRIAEIYRRSGRFDDAVDALKKAETYVPDSIELPYDIALIYSVQGKYDEAEKILQDLIGKSEKAGNRAMFLERLGGIYRDTNRTQQAVDTFRKMLALGNDDAIRGYQELIDTYREAKQWPQATAVAQEAVQKFPKDRTLKLAYASQLADNGQADQAIQQARSLLNGTAEDREVYLNLGNMYTRLKRWQEADESLNKALALSNSQEDKDNVSFMIAASAERQKKYDEAETIFKKLLANNPNSAGTLNYLGYMLADRGVRLDEALGYLKKAVQLDPQNGAYLDSIGWAYYKMGDYILAEENLRRATDRIGSDPTVQDHLGEVYAKTGRLKLATIAWERALTEWNKSVPADVDQNDVAKVQKKLESAKVKLARQQERKSAEATKP